MSAITRLDKDGQAIIVNLSNGGKSRSLLVSIAIGKAIASSLSMPSSGVADVEQLYKTMHLINVQNTLSEINEMVVLDTDAILSYVSKFFAVRYAMLSPSMTVFCMNSETALEDFMGISQVMDQATIAAIREKPVELTAVHNGIVKLLAQLSA